MRMDKPTVLLSLPNELLLYYIFVYLHSTDLLRAFSQLHNRRLNALLYAHIQHIDFLTTDISVVPIDKWLSYLSSLKTNTIVSLRINLDHFNYPLCYMFPTLNRLDLHMTTVSERVSQITIFTRLKILSITMTSEKPKKINGLVSSIWHSNSCLESLSTSNCFILDKNDIFPTSSRSLMINRNLTHLSLDLDRICIAIILMPFVPALKHFELRLHNIHNQTSIFRSEFLQRQEWPTKVRSLRIIAYDQLMDSASFCIFVRRFSLSLERLSFYISTHQRFLMSGSRSLQRHLLDYLSHLKQIEFCVHSGVKNNETDRRRTFDHWTKKEVISIFHSRQFLTRFTMPFSFDRLEHMSNDFVDYHWNYCQSNDIVSFPSIVMIIFHSPDKLNLSLFTFIQQTCPSLCHLRFKQYCNLNDDLVQNTTLTLATATELCLNDVTSPIDIPVLCRVLSMIPNLKHLTAQRRHIDLIETMNSDANVLGHITKVTISSNVVHRRTTVRTMDHFFS